MRPTRTVSSLAVVALIKTTLLDLIGCIDRPTRGSIVVGGQGEEAFPMNPIANNPTAIQGGPTIIENRWRGILKLIPLIAGTSIVPVAMPLRRRQQRMGAVRWSMEHGAEPTFLPR